MDTLGFLETTSIAAGVEIADKMLKTSNVELLFARASCPGKFYILITGDVSSVELSLRQGEETGRGFVVSTTLLPRIHPQVIKAISAGTMPESPAAIGVLEYYSVTASLAAADIAVKAANVELVDIRLGTGIGGKSFVLLAGEISTVQNAVAAAMNAQNDVGLLVNSTVVANPKRELLDHLA